MMLFNFPMSDPIKDVIEPMKEIGPEHYLISTDCGYAESPAPVEAMRLFIRMLLDHGFSENDVIRMAHENAAKVLGLD
jgi:predicted metal-dependent TIM-barrel fold hydrolase